MLIAEWNESKSLLKTIGEIVAGVATVAGAVYVALQSDDESTNYFHISDDNNSFDGENGMRCANCGNTDESTLWDEGDTIYCSKCCHRTSFATGEDDLVECPYCHRMKDRKSLYCRWCNDSTWQPSTKEEFEETDSILKEMGF